MTTRQPTGPRCGHDHPCLTRRAVLAVGGAAGVATLAACSGPETGSPGSGTPSADGTGEDTPSGTTSPETGETSEQGAEAIANVSDVPVGGALAATTAAGEAVLLTQPTEGEIHAFSTVCTHQGCTVEPGEGELSCPCHGSTFDLGSGAPLAGPAAAALPEVTVSVGEDGSITG
ncbi:Rieske (2Fe-2S) protein [Serinicoccus marinus]|uniref:Rieske (2Fe-2S) protein n=1 Tax=Serinicoccus marinus TaxID=247333 RepID=UPI00249242E4|nr:Rieske 2Fe-2S domain-containing protein [Serinicoccus marinus]